MTDTIEADFPSKWNYDSVGAHAFYDKCKDYVNNENDFYDLTKTSIFYYVFGGVAGAFVICVNCLLFYNFNNYLFKRQCRLYYFCLMLGSIIIVFDSYLLGILYESYSCYVHHLLTGVGYGLYFWSIAFIIVKYYKYYYISQVAYLQNFLEYNDNENKDKLLNKKFIFKPFYTHISTSLALKCLACYIAFNIALSTVIRSVNESISSDGFCLGGPIYIMQMLSIVLFLVCFLPLSLYEALKFDDKFRMKKTIIVFIILHIIYYTGYMVESTRPKLLCSKIVQTFPPGIFVLLSVVTSTSLLSLTMVNEIIHLNKCNKNLKSTYKGMFEMLEDRVQFREFGEFCRNENCVENILFYQEFWKYKRLFNKNVKNFFHDPLKSQEILETTSISLYNNISKNNGINESNNASKATGVNEPKSIKDEADRMSSMANSTVSGNSSKMTKNEQTAIETIEKEAKKFVEHFIGSKALYEINIQHFIITYIIDKLESLQNDDRTIEDKVEEYYTIFDRAYKEVINNIYLNSYSNYVHQKNKEKKGEKDKRVSQLSSMC